MVCSTLIGWVTIPTLRPGWAGHGVAPGKGVTAPVLGPGVKWALPTGVAFLAVLQSAAGGAAAASRRPYPPYPDANRAVRTTTRTTRGPRPPSHRFAASFISILPQHYRYAITSLYNAVQQ